MDPTASVGKTEVWLGCRVLPEIEAHGPNGSHFELDATAIVKTELSRSPYITRRLAGRHVIRELHAHRAEGPYARFLGCSVRQKIIAALMHCHPTVIGILGIGFEVRPAV